MLLTAVATGRGYSRVWIHRLPLGLHDMTIMTMEQPEVESHRVYVLVTSALNRPRQGNLKVTDILGSIIYTDLKTYNKTAKTQRRHNSWDQAKGNELTEALQSS